MAGFGFGRELALGVGHRAFVDPDVALADRVEMLLSTRPGDLVWLPGYGCDLEPLTGEGATDFVLELARMRIREAIERWLPDVEIQSLDVTVERVHTPGFAPETPVERALVPLGVQGRMVVSLSLRADGEPAQMIAEVQP